MTTRRTKPTRRIPLLDLKAQYRPLKDRIEKAIERIAEEQSFIMGEDMRLLEREIASYCGTKFGIGVSSGTDALILALKAAGIKEGDEVITSAFTFMATAGAICNAGGKPVFCDIDPKTYNIDPHAIGRRITDGTKAIVPVHLYGQCAEMDEISKVAGDRNFLVIEDAAQAIGATYKGRKAASMGEAGCLSFFPSKNLGAFGDAGMAVTNNERLASRISALRDHGNEKRYIHSMIGTNARLDNIQAAVLRIKLEYLDSWIEKRQKNANIYDELFKNSGVSTPYVAPKNTHVYHQYVIKVPADKREALIGHLAQCGIESRVYYPVPLHLQECFRSLGYKKGDLPHAEEAANSLLALPVYPELTPDDLSYVVETIKSFL